MIEKEDEVTHKVFFGENIRRVKRFFKNKKMEKKFKVWDKELKRFVIYAPHMSIDLNGNVYNLQDGEGGKERYELIQYSGIKDKNGKEIYEGDIIIGSLTIEEDNFDFEGAVIFDEGIFTCEEADFGNLLTYSELEIVGNIYENKNL